MPAIELTLSATLERIIKHNPRITPAVLSQALENLAVAALDYEKTKDLAALEASRTRIINSLLDKRQLTPASNPSKPSLPSERKTEPEAVCLKASVGTQSEYGYPKRKRHLSNMTQLDKDQDDFNQGGTITTMK